MADEDAEQDRGSSRAAAEGGLLDRRRLRERLLSLETALRESGEAGVGAAAEYCQQLCQSSRDTITTASGSKFLVPSRPFCYIAPLQRQIAI
ncbi:UNVERIFIED_CONTAM: hypothetical protein K2H54_066340 [Gekko kuhli]